ncbi:molecular chaperone HtpG [Iodidimonas sp. SYSU 1G8]|uniref:molecular chaperone HtpG n=1 Tax=Iodidimonas sp. SYSU 1G8 TaxID=3133967 RepID=UPI0031FEEC0F
MSTTETVEKHEFQAEVARLLNMMVRSVYSETEIFLRELISNASDACDRLRYDALTDPSLTEGDSAFRIAITADAAARTLTIADNGIGMNRDDLIANLGTIARSGTAAFMEKLSGDSKKDVSLIGQFGVGFYAAFMVADKVEVTSRKAGDAQAWKWTSDGQGSYTIEPAARDGRGTTIVLHVREDESEYLDVHRLRHIVTTYSDHIAFPIHLSEVKDGAVTEEESVNKGSALWTRPKAEVTDEQYTAFYRHAGHAFDAPALTLHYRAEGAIEYTALLFVPEERPLDLFDPARKPRVKLYVKRVFITDDTDDLIPGYLRFLRGVVDSEDLPLNVSREMLQNNPVVARMRKAVTGRVVSALEAKAKDDADGFDKIWSSFGPVIKEGIYEDGERRGALLKIARFRSTHGDGWTTLGDYLARMKEGQDAIYYVSAPDIDAARRSPHLEGFTSRGVEVLLLTDPVDDFWLSMVPEHEGKAFRSVTRGGADLSKLDGKDESAEKPADDARMVTLIAALKHALGDQVKDVRTTDRLTGSAVCLVADDGDMDLNLQRLLKQHNQLGFEAQRILEINPGHPLIAALAERADQPGALDALGDPALLLLDQARILEGELPADPAAFARRLADLMAKGLA